MLNRLDMRRYHNDEQMIRLYVLCFGIISFIGMWEDTTLWILPRIPLRIIWLCEIIIAYKMFCYDMWKYNNKLIYFFALISAILIKVSSNSTMAFDWIALVMGAKGVPFDKILKIWLKAVVPVIVIAIIASQIGFIENKIFNTATGGQRYAFGFSHPTNFGAHIFYFSVAVLCLSFNKKSLYPLPLLFLISGFVYYYSNPRLAVYSTWILIIGYICINNIQIKNNKTISRILLFISKHTVFFMAGLSMYITFIYTVDNNIMLELNRILSNRVWLSNIGWKYFTPTLFGQNLESFFSCVKSLENINFYYIDTTYQKVLINYGLVGFSLFCLSFYKMAQNVSANKFYSFLVVLFTVNCMIDSQFIGIVTCPFPLLAFADIENFKMRN